MCLGCSVSCCVLSSFPPLTPTVSVWSSLEGSCLSLPCSEMLHDFRWTRIKARKLRIASRLQHAVLRLAGSFPSADFPHLLLAQSLPGPSSDCHILLPECFPQTALTSLHLCSRVTCTQRSSAITLPQATCLTLSPLCFIFSV